MSEFQAARKFAHEKARSLDDGTAGADEASGSDVVPDIEQQRSFEDNCTRTDVHSTMPVLAQGPLITKHGRAGMFLAATVHRRINADQVNY
jgi:hypothetical protein